MAFNALPIAETTWQGRPFPAGLYRDVCHIPGDLLNNGVYWVELLIVQDDTTAIFKLENALVFEVRDTPEVRGAWFGDWPGVVRPILRWSTEQLRADDPVPREVDTTIA